MDYPGNLYFFLTEIISRFNDQARLIWVTTGIFLILVLIFSSLFNYYKNPPIQNKISSIFNSSYFFLFIVSLFIILQRLPAHLSGQLNTDEDLWMAGGATIINDPRFWVSFDPTTSGPLVVLPVILTKLFGSNINYASVRLAALLFCIIPSIILLYFSFKNIFNERISRIIILPLLICMSFMHLKNYIAYNSEHIPILLTSLSIFVYSKIYKNGKLSPSYLYLLFGLTLGCFPYSKLQVVPIGLGIAFIIIIHLLKEFSGNKKEIARKLFLFLTGCLTPSILVLFYLTGSNGLKDFWLSYIISNLNYANNGLNGQISLWLKLKYFIYLLRTVPDSGLYFISLFFISTIALLILFFFKRRELCANKNMLVLPSIIILTSYYGIVKPSTFYEHYLLLFFIPVLFFSGTVIGLFQKAFHHYKSFNIFLMFFIFSTIIVPSFYYFTHASSVNSFHVNADDFKKYNAADIIAKYAGPGDKMAIWGWMTDLYIQTGLTLGTRYGDSYHQITESKLQSYYINNYVLDLERNKPKVFIDVITPDAYFFNDLRNRHESYSIIDSYIQENYRKVGEVDQIRIYIRN